VRADEKLTAFLELESAISGDPQLVGSPCSDLSPFDRSGSTFERRRLHYQS